MSPAYRPFLTPRQKPCLARRQGHRIGSRGCRRWRSPWRTTANDPAPSPGFFCSPVRWWRSLSAYAPLEQISDTLLDAANMVLAADVVARDEVPPFRNSAMDGYAVRA